MAIATLLALTATARAATITVDSLADTGAPGICVLRNAITAANTLTATNGCAAGTGNDTIEFSVTGTITLASTLPQVTDGLLTIKGPASPGIIIDGGNNVQIMQVASNATLNLTNLTMARGFTQTTGGGILNNGTLTITNSTFSHNSTPEGGDGGAIDNVGTLTISNTTFSANSAPGDCQAGCFGGFGGAIDNQKTLTVTDSTFSGNSGVVGAIFNGSFTVPTINSTLAVTNTTFAGNIGIGVGSIENLFQSTAVVSDSTFSRNIGVGIDNEGVATVTNSTFSNNSATTFGADGGGVVNTGPMIIADSTFFGNSAATDGAGGGIANYDNLTVTNTTFAGNAAPIGGGIYNQGSLAATSTTFFGNRASEGGGVYEYNPGSFKSSILAASSGSNCSCVGFSCSISNLNNDAGYNISDDATCGFSAIGSLNNTDPMLDPAGLSNNGGPTQTIALLADSSAIDAIPLADCTDQASPPNPIITDQRLFPRPDAGEQACDIGAYEVQDTAFVPFSRFNGGLKIDSQETFFSLSGGFKLGSGSSIDPTTQPVAFSVGSYTIRLPVGSFFKVSNGFVYQKKVNGVFLCLYIKLTDTPGNYVLLAIERGATPASTTLVPVTLTIGDDSGTTHMKAKFD